MLEQVNWKEEGWIVVNPAYPRGFTEMAWEDLPPRPPGAPPIPNVKAYDADGKQIGRCIAFDTNTKTAWVVGKPIWVAQKSERKLVPVPFDRLEEIYDA